MAARELIVVGGPNGAGKTTFVRSFLNTHPYPYLSADAIAAELAPHDVASVQVQAGREFLLRVDETLAREESFIVESTLSGKTLQRTIQRAKAKGYEMTVVFLFVDKAETSIERVQERVLKGGHHVPEEDIRRRFLRSWHNFWHTYRYLADWWVMVYNGLQAFHDVAVGEGENVYIIDEYLYRPFLREVRRVEDLP